MWNLMALALTLGFSGGSNLPALQTPSQSAETFERKITKTVSGRFLVGLPKDYGEESGKRWPLIIFLHGSGERGSNLEVVKVHGPPKLIAQGKELPFIVVSPQCPENTSWDIDSLNGMLDHLLKKYHVDADRVYLTGLSMGGYGTWRWATENPERFAALVPICGGGDPSKVDKIKHLPIWVFHGMKDGAVPFQRSQEMVDALKRLGNDVKFSIDPEGGHDVWTAAYNQEELYTWLLQFKRQKPPKR